MKNGGRFLRKRLPPRPLTIKYQLVASTSEAFRESFNQLNFLMSQDESQLIFEDEDDKYFTGTLASTEKVPPGTNNIIGEMGIICANPYKNGVERVVETELDFINEGNVSAPCAVRVVFRSSTQGFRIKHVQQEKETRLTWSFAGGDILEIDMNKRLITINGLVRMTAFDFRSQMFYVSVAQNTLEASVPDSWIETSYRPRWL
jgi:predicted phage tail component-like protein